MCKHDILWSATEEKGFCLKCNKRFVELFLQNGEHSERAGIYETNIEKLEKITAGVKYIEDERVADSPFQPLTKQSNL